ncbi:MAG TPA: 50S ribosomal protein L5 [Desulfohalobiaceae bacterium]|nr:50S ribosomal protein L5 [Desulfohalobiaceae bacterium]
MRRLFDIYKEKDIPSMQKEFVYKSIMQIPCLKSIALNMGLGEGSQDNKLIQDATQELSLISGQKAVVTRAKKSIAAFKLREGMPVGCRVTLRRNFMWEFFDKLVNISLPRVRDFRGVHDRGFDGRGNYTLGIKEHTIFPEISPDKIDRVKGLNVTVVTSAHTDKEGKMLLQLLGMPFIK